MGLEDSTPPYSCFEKMIVRPYKKKQKALPAVFASKALEGVTNRARTGDIQNHNLALYQLSYSHHKVEDPIVQPPVRDASLEKCRDREQ